jgi:hypothetical protein
LIRNCPVTSDDAKRALKTYGPDIATLKGKTVKKQNQGIPNFQAAQIPVPIIEQYKNVRLFIDIFWVNGSPYFHTISEWVKFRTVAAINNRNKRTLHMETQAVINMHETRGFSIARVEGGREFSCITNELLPTPINIADADDHVAEVERSIRTIKERTRCLVQGLPYRRIPKAMMRAAIENATKVLNHFPAQNGVSDTLSPLTIMTGKPGPDYNDLKIEFGAYTQVFEDNDPTNITKARTTGAIALTPTGNAQGGYFFLSLTTGRKISRQQWDELPMPDGIIATVEHMAQTEQQPLLGPGAPLFEWSPGVEIEDDTPQAIQEEDGDDHTEAANREDEGAEILLGNEPDPEEEGEREVEAGPEEQVVYVHQEDDRSETESGHDNEHEGDKEEGQDDLPEGQPAEEPEEEPEEDAVADTGTTTEGQTRHNLRPNRGRDYSNRFGHIMDDPANSKIYDAQFIQNTEDGMPELREAVEEMQRTGSNTSILKCLTGIIVVQMTAKAGIKKHGQVAIDTLFDEFLQLHDLGFFLGQDEAKLTGAQKRGALRALNVIKEKRCGKIKGRTVANGRGQRNLYTKEETSSPTVSTDALLISTIIDATEHRDVATADVRGAYIHAKMVDFTLLKIEGESVDIMCNVCEVYRKFVCYEKGKKVLYLKLLKALYGCVQSALLWYKNFAGTLLEMGFKMNPYDTCVANKTIEGKQCTIVWYVDGTKISHVDNKVVSYVINKIEERFGEMTVTQGKEHLFLGMNIDFHKDGTATIKMKDYMKEAIADFGESITREAMTPAKKTLFEIDESSGALTEANRETFHSVVAKLLYMSKRGRLDIQLPIAFLCT